MIKNVIFDIGNVCVTFNPLEYFLPFFQNENKTKKLITHIFGNQLWRDYDQGIICEAQLRKRYIETLNDDPLDIHFILDHWKPLMKAIPSTYKLMQELKKEGYCLYILSNINLESANYLNERMPFFSIVDGAVLSYEEKLVKPDPMIYHCLMKRYGVCCHECIFIDDLKENIEQAIQLGIHGIVYHNALQVENDVWKRIQEEKVC